MPATDNDIKKWYPVSTKSRAEKKAHLALLQKDITSYLPLQKKLKQWSDRKKWIEEPLVPSYVFVHISNAQQREVLMTTGIARFIYFADGITSIPDRQIEDLKLLTASPYEMEITAENLKQGEKITVKSGPLKGLEGEVVRYHSRIRLLVRLTELNNTIVVHVPAALIERQ